MIVPSPGNSLFGGAFTGQTFSLFQKIERPRHPVEKNLAHFGRVHPVRSEIKQRC